MSIGHERYINKVIIIILLLSGLITGGAYIPGGILPEILDRSVPPRFVNPYPI